MRREKTTLRAFGGGVDPEEVDLDENEEVRKREELVKIGDNHTITDLGIRLERDLVERLDPRLFATGEERRQLKLQPREATWEEALYLRAVPTETGRTFEQAVAEYKGYPTVGLPRAFLRNEQVKGITNPFHEATSDDEVVLRYLPEDVIEIYPLEVYKAHPQWTWIRAGLPFIVLSSDGAEEVGCYNMAMDTYSGQMFEIVPFDWRVFSTYYREIILNQGLLAKMYHKITDDVLVSVKRPTLEEFQQVKREGGVKPCSSPRIAFEWWEGASFEKLGPDLGFEDMGRFRVILPAYGYFIISTLEDIEQFPAYQDLDPLFHRSPESIHQIRRLCSNLTRINDQWWGRFYEVRENGPPIIYFSTIPEEAKTSLPSGKVPTVRVDDAFSG